MFSDLLLPPKIDSFAIHICGREIRRATGSRIGRIATRFHGFAPQRQCVWADRVHQQLRDTLSVGSLDLRDGASGGARGSPIRGQHAQVGISSAHRSISTCAMLAAKSGSSITAGHSFARAPHSRAAAVPLGRRSRRCWCSWPSRNLAYVQPLFSSRFDLNRHLHSRTRSH